MADTPNGEQSQRDSSAFLIADFNKSIELLQHYDKIAVGVLKFTFFVYSALIGLAVAFMKLDSGQTMQPTFQFVPEIRVFISVVLLISGFCGFMFLWIFLRNRCYFVRVARHANEIRCFYLKGNPIGFKNEAQMYQDVKRPRYFNASSSSAIAFYYLSAFNAVLITLAMMMIFSISICKSLISFLLLTCIQIVASILYLHKQEKSEHK